MEFCASVGLVLDPWQGHVLEGSLGEVGPVWAAFEVGIVVPRQNGKGGIIEARELSQVALFGGGLIAHTSHELKTSTEAMLRMQNICEASPELCLNSKAPHSVKAYYRSNGKEAIVFKNGARIAYIARTKGSGRGMSGRLIVMDEAMFLTQESMAALLPTLAAADNPQILYAGSAGLQESDHLRAVRQRALAGGDPSLAYFEWSAEEDADREDREAWAMANPALGIRISEQFVARELLALGDAEFDRERLGIWEGGKRSTVIDLKRWDNLKDENSKIVGQPCFAIDVTPDRARASIGVAGRRADGNRHVEIVPHDDAGNFDQTGTGWVVPRMVAVAARAKVKEVLLDGSSPAASLESALREAGLEPRLISAREMGQACGGIYDHAAASTLRHINQPQIASALGAARKRPMGDAWKWHRKDLTDISPLVAVTVALFGHDKAPQKKRSGKVW